MSDDVWIRIDEAAAIAGCSVEAMRGRVRRYKLPVARVNTRRVFVRKADVLAHVQAMQPR